MAEENGDLAAPQGEETIAQERPDWLPDNFASPEDLARSYTEAQRKIAEQGNELSRLRPLEEQIDELSQLVQQQQPSQPTFDPHSHPLIAGAQQALDQGDVVGLIAAIQALQQPQAPAPAKAELDPYFVGQVHDSVAQRYGADEQMRNRAIEIMEQDPLVANSLLALSENPNATVGDLVPIVDAAYRLVRSEGVSQEQASLAQRQAEQETARQRKLDSETLTGSGPTRVASPSEQQQAWDEIKNADLGTLRIGSQ